MPQLKKAQKKYSNKKKNEEEEVEEKEINNASSSSDKVEKEEEIKKEEEEEEENDQTTINKIQPIKVIYCPECSYPIEFCEFSDKWKLCAKWLEVHHPKVLAELNELRDQDKNKDKKIDKKVAKEVDAIVEGKVEEKKEITGRELLLKIDKRSKKKRITMVTGIDKYMDDVFKGDEKNLKELVKNFGKKFACGCAIVKKPELSIEIQGDVAIEVAQHFIRELGVNENQVYVLEDKKKYLAKERFYDDDDDDDSDY
ncbi:hypothetical protein ABK040_015188 [Willaertia magna]